MPLQQRQVLVQHLTLRSAADLPTSDFSVTGTKSDPYVSLKLNGTKPSRPCRKNTFNPVRDAATSALNVEVYELDTLNPDDLLCVLAAKLADEMDMSTLEFGDHE